MQEWQMRAFVKSIGDIIGNKGQGDKRNSNGASGRSRGKNGSEVRPPRVYPACGVCGGTNHAKKNCRHAEKTCHLCQCRGHLASFCRARPSPTARKTPPRANAAITRAQAWPSTASPPVKPNASTTAPATVNVPWLCQVCLTLNEKCTISTCPTLTARGAGRPRRTTLRQNTSS